ncbi:MAG: SMC family ATPase [Candidatus Heimdallarchaeota archaeon]|nr:MAG: SMC family ATPase [Candidatus Heimdallarchaeota archaeon]
MSIQARIGLGFDLQEMALYRFMNYQTPVKFDFKAPYIVIAGPTGSGKTTILDALTFALFGKSSRLDLMSVKIEDICRKNGNVHCKFKTGDNMIRIKRGRDKKGKSYLELFINDKRVPGKIPELNEKIRSTILGMNYQSFVNSTIIRQDEMKALGSKSSTERLRTLQNLFRLDIFEKAINDTQKRLQEVLNEKNQKEGGLNVKKEEIEKGELIETELTELKPQLVSQKEEHTALLKVVEKLKESKEDRQKELERFQTLLTTKENAEARLKTQLKDFSEANREFEKYQKLQSQMTKLESQTREIKNLEDEMKALENVKKDYSLIKSHLDTLMKKKKEKEDSLGKDLENKLERLKKEQNRTKKLSTTIDHETAFKLLNQEGRLLERIQRISLEQSWNIPKKILQELHDEQVQARKELKELQTEKKGINKDSFVLSEIFQRISELEEEVQELELRLKQEQEADEKELLTEKKKLEELNYTPERNQELIVLKDKHRSILKVQEEYEKTKQEVKDTVDPTSKVSTIEKQVRETEREINKIKIQLKGYLSFKKEYEKITEELEAKRKKERSLENTISVLVERIKNQTHQIEELKKLKPEIELLEKEIKTLVKEEEILEKLKREVFHTKGAPFYAINKVLPRLGRRASFILTELTNDRFSHIQLQKVDSGRHGMGFEILIKVPEGTRDVATFSGGERTQINAALRLAISEEISELGQVGETVKASKKTLFIDEGDLGSLDTLEAQQAFVTKLFKLTKRFKIILITHLQEIADQFPHSINITRDSYGRSIKAEEASS